MLKNIKEARRGWREVDEEEEEKILKDRRGNGAGRDKLKIHILVKKGDKITLKMMFEIKRKTIMFLKVKHDASIFQPD